MNIGACRGVFEGGATSGLATLVAARHGGITLDDVIERFSVSKRTAQRMLRALEAQFLALVPRSKAARLETDHEALLEAQGLATRPGPRQRIDRRIAAAIAEAIKACRILEVEYQSRDEPAPRMRRLARYGLLTGLRRYLLARPAEKRKPNFKGWLDPQDRYRLPKIEDVK